jgi:hypothetical protein
MDVEKRCIAMLATTAPGVPTPKLASMVLASFSRLVKTGELNVHPVAARQVDADLLRKLAGDGAAAKPA